METLFITFWIYRTSITFYKIGKSHLCYNGTRDIPSLAQRWGKRWKLLSGIEALVNSRQVLLANMLKREYGSQRCHKTMEKEPGVSHQK